MDNFENTRDQLARCEHEINAAREKREQQERSEARSQRERLEKQSPSGARRGLVNLLNDMEHERAAVAAPGLDVITKIREQQKYGYKTDSDHNRTYARLEKSADFNRLHPLSRSVQAGVSYGEARLPESRAVKPRGNFDFGPGEPGNKDGSRFEWDQRFDPPRRVGIVPDAAGRLVGDRSGAR